jgi:hypothetical protein
MAQIMMAEKHWTPGDAMIMAMRISVSVGSGENSFLSAVGQGKRSPAKYIPQS